jgi:hypothetical protein
MDFTYTRGLNALELMDLAYQLKNLTKARVAESFMDDKAFIFSQTFVKGIGVWKLI